MNRLLTIALVACLFPALSAHAQNDPVATGDPVADAREIFLAGDHATALAALRPLAEAGNARAQNLLGAAHQYGLGVPADADLALSWFARAAEQGFPPALHNLGVLHEDGMAGLDPDPVLARDHYARAAALDYGPSLSSHGRYLLLGLGGPVDEVNAVRQLRRGAELGDPVAHEWMGIIHAEGRGVAQDLVIARHHYRIAAAQGMANAQVQYGLMLETGEGGPVDLQGAHAAYDAAFAQGSADGAFNLSWLMLSNEGMFGDPVDALGYCFWSAQNAAADVIADFAASCEDWAQSFTPAERRQAEKIADGL